MSNVTRWFFIFALMITVGAGCANGSTSTPTAMQQDWSFQGALPEERIANKQARISTNRGDIVIAFYADTAPLAVSNFVYLAEGGYYDSVIFHRVIESFMIQGGDPQGTGSGGPGYRFDDEPFEGEYTRGTVAMANSGPNTNGSQFFIMHQDYALPKDYVIFGQVISGLEVVDKIATAQVTMGSDGAASKPVEPVTIQDVRIIEE